VRTRDLRHDRAHHAAEASVTSGNGPWLAVGDNGTPVMHRYRTMAGSRQAAPRFGASFGCLVTLLVLAGCSSSRHNGPGLSTLVTGVLQMVGGPPPGAPRPLAGDVTIYRGKDSTGSQVAAVRTDAKGRFRVDLSPGTFFFVGHSSSVPGMLCTTDGPITLASGPASVAVVCNVP